MMSLSVEQPACCDACQGGCECGYDSSSGGESSRMAPAGLQLGGGASSCAVRPPPQPADASLLRCVRPWVAGWCECPTWCECKTCHPAEELEFDPVVYEGGKKVARVKPRRRVSQKGIMAQSGLQPSRVQRDPGVAHMLPQPRRTQPYLPVCHRCHRCRAFQGRRAGRPIRCTPSRRTALPCHHSAPVAVLALQHLPSVCCTAQHARGCNTGACCWPR
jgi:hypothetical protein